MELSKTFAKLQTAFGATKAELGFVSLLLAGLLLGGAAKYAGDQKPGYNRELSEIVYASLDSLAEVERTTFIGTDIDDNPYAELALADTVRKDDGYFPKSKKKELPEEKININTASKVELMKLPGVGEATAKKIIKYRQKHGGFKTIDEIMKIKGIAQKKFEKLKKHIKVESSDSSNI